MAALFHVQQYEGVFFSKRHVKIEDFASETGITCRKARISDGFYMFLEEKSGNIVESVKNGGRIDAAAPAVCIAPIASIALVTGDGRLNQPDRYIPVFFVYWKQIACHADHITCSYLYFQGIQAVKRRVTGHGV